MRRFLMNQMWTLALAALLGLVGVTAMSGTAYSDTVWGDDGTEGTQTEPPPDGAGDPDSPANGGKPAAAQAVNGGQAGVIGVRGAGDASVNRQAAMLARVRWMVHALKAYYLRF